LTCISNGRNERTARCDDSRMNTQIKPAKRMAFELRVGTAADLDILCEIDTDASELFVRAGLDVELPAFHEFTRAEQARWLRSLSSGSALLAVDPSDSVLGFATGGTQDGEPYLDQLSVRQRAMGLGIGSTLLAATEIRALESGADVLWLTTYGHLSWNRPFYERRDFRVIPESELRPEMLAELEYERRWLPAPEQRVVMRKILRPRSV
jgi:GNAT superfamily N-acetyltransferase